jgi:antitoxin VapB
MTKFASLFTNGRSQAVRLPKEFRFPGDRVRISRTVDGVLLRPAKIDVDALFEFLDRNPDPTFMAEVRDQPPMPPEKKTFD